MSALRGWREVERELTSIERRTDRAQMWVLREAGRVGAREARRAAPVLSGSGAVLTGRRQGPQVDMRGNRPVPGLLRASIRPAKKLRKLGEHSWAHRVAPRGMRVHLYSGKAEARHGYMAQAQQVVDGRIEGIAARAYERSTRPRG